jgi:hypothetical protein
LVINEDDSVGVPPMGAQMVHDLASTNLAQPGEDRGLATEIFKFPHRFAQRGLDDFARGLGVTSQTRQRETIEARKVAVEKRVEGALVARQHPPDEFRLVRQLTIPIEAQ